MGDPNNRRGLMMSAEKDMLSAFEGKRILIIVPHQDDEINVAGTLLAQFSKMNVEVYVVYATNGDALIKAYRRYNEARQALKRFHILKDHIIFLGYPDVSKIGTNCVYLTSFDETFRSEAGYTATYAPGNEIDYIYSQQKIHHKYNHENLCRDITSIILEKKPDFIISNDMDSHPNHKELYIILQEAIRRVLAATENYTPLIMTTYAYDLAFNSVEDYSAINLDGSTSRGQGENPILNWEERLRLPVPMNARTKLLANNIIFKAMWNHHSQSGYLFAPRIANSDKVYWVRRTNSKSYTARIEASSGDVHYLNDFQYFILNDELNIDYSKLWFPQKNDTDKRIRMLFEKNISIEEIVLFENSYEKYNITRAKITLSNGYQQIVNEINHSGGETRLRFLQQNNIEWLEFEILESEGEYAGLTEIEVYEPCTRNPWFIKICHEDNYIYKYYTEQDVFCSNVLIFDQFGQKMDIPNGWPKVEKSPPSSIRDFNNIITMKLGNKCTKLKVEYKDKSDEVHIIRSSKIQKEIELYNILDKLIEKLYICVDWFVNEYYRVIEFLNKI